MKQITDLPIIPPRQSNAHKGNFGKVLVLAGSKCMSGAAALIGTAALNCGAGLVRVATSASAQPVVASLNPCYTTAALPEDKLGQINSDAFAKVAELARQHDIIAAGPGLGTAKTTRNLIISLIKLPDIKIVMDADGLNCLSQVRNWHNYNKADMIITPHPGEFAKLWKSIFREPMPDDRVKSASKMALQTNTTVLLKGAQTVVTNGEKYYINTTGNPGMATAGAGDVLTGVIAALAGQAAAQGGYDLTKIKHRERKTVLGGPDFGHFQAAQLGAYLHGLAGDIAANTHVLEAINALEIAKNLSNAIKKHIKK